MRIDLVDLTPSGSFSYQSRLNSIINLPDNTSKLCTDCGYFVQQLGKTTFNKEIILKTKLFIA